LAKLYEKRYIRNTKKIVTFYYCKTRDRPKHTSHRCLFLEAAAGLHFDFFEPEFNSWSQCSAPHTSAKQWLSFWIQHSYLISVINATASQIEQRRLPKFSSFGLLLQNFQS